MPRAGQLDRISILGVWTGQLDQIVTQDMALGTILKLAHDPALEVGLGAVAFGLGLKVVTFGSLFTDRSHGLKR